MHDPEIPALPCLRCNKIRSNTERSSDGAQFTTVILPYVYLENPDGKIKWNVWSFDEGMASRVPYEAAARVLAQSHRSFAGYTVRHGLAITMGKLLPNGSAPSACSGGLTMASLCRAQLYGERKRP